MAASPAGCWMLAGPGGQKPRTPGVHLSFVVPSHLCFCPCPRRPWTASRQEPDDKQGGISVESPRTGGCEWGEGRSAGTGWGTEENKSAGHHELLAFVHLFVFPGGAVVRPSQVKILHHFLNRQPQQAPFWRLSKAATGTCPLHPVGGTGRQRPPMRREGAVWRLPFPLKMVRVFPDLRARLPSLSTRPSPRTIKRACHRSYPEPCAFLRPRPSRFSSRKSSRSNNVHLLRISPIEYPLGGLGFPPFCTLTSKAAQQKKTGAPVIETEAARASSSSSSSTCSTATSLPLSPRLSCTDLPSLAHGLRLLGHPSTSIHPHQPRQPRGTWPRAVVPTSRRVLPRYLLPQKVPERVGFHRRHRLLSPHSPHSRLLSSLPSPLSWLLAVRRCNVIRRAGIGMGRPRPRVHDKGRVHCARRGVVRWVVLYPRLSIAAVSMARLDSDMSRMVPLSTTRPGPSALGHSYLPIYPCPPAHPPESRPLHGQLGSLSCFFFVLDVSPRPIGLCNGFVSLRGPQNRVYNIPKGPPRERHPWSCHCRGLPIPVVLFDLVPVLDSSTTISPLSLPLRLRPPALTTSTTPFGIPATRPSASLPTAPYTPLPTTLVFSGKATRADPARPVLHRSRRLGYATRSSCRSSPPPPPLPGH